MKRINNIWLFAGAASMLVVSCKVTDPYHKPEISNEKLNRLYGKEINAQDSLSTANVSWDKILRMPICKILSEKQFRIIWI